MRRILCMLLTLACLMGAGAAYGEVELLPPVQGWDLTHPITLEVSADVSSHMPYNEDRLAQLTALIKHLSLRMHWQTLGEETWSGIAVLVDGKEAMSLHQRQTPDVTELQLSALPESVYTFPAGEENALSALLGQETAPMQLFGLDGTEHTWLDEAYEMFGKLGDELADYKKESTVKTVIKDMGTARMKRVYSVPKDEADAMAKALLASCPDGRLSKLLGSLTFSGKQVFTLWLDGDENILRIEYQGNMGEDDKHLRKVDLTWRLCRRDDEIRDNVTLKTPAAKGTDRNSITYVRDLVSKKNQVDYDCEFTYEWVKDKKKTTLSGEIDLRSKEEKEGYRLTGDVSVKQQLPEQDNADRMVFSPDVLIASSQDDPSMPHAEGELNVQQYRGKKLTEDATLKVKLEAAEPLSWVMQPDAIHVPGLDKDAADALHTHVLNSITAELLPHLVLLPEEDTLFLSADLPEKVWKQIVNAARDALSKEELP